MHGLFAFLFSAKFPGSTLLLFSVMIQNLSVFCLLRGNPCPSPVSHRGVVRKKCDTIQEAAQESGNRFLICLSHIYLSTMQSLMEMVV